jgi:hypothetical protein
MPAGPPCGVLTCVVSSWPAPTRDARPLPAGSCRVVTLILSRCASGGVHASSTQGRNSDHWATWSKWTSLGGKGYSYVWFTNYSGSAFTINVIGGDGAQWMKDRHSNGTWSGWYRG